MQLSGTMPVLHVQGTEFDYHQKINSQTNRNLLGATISHKQSFQRYQGMLARTPRAS